MDQKTHKNRSKLETRPVEVLSALKALPEKLRFQDQIIQTIPMGWVDQVMRLEPGDRVSAFFKVNDGRLGVGGLAVGWVWFGLIGQKRRELKGCFRRG